MFHWDRVLMTPKYLQQVDFPLGLPLHILQSSVPLVLQRSGARGARTSTRSPTAPCEVLRIGHSRVWSTFPCAEGCALPPFGPWASLSAPSPITGRISTPTSLPSVFLVTRETAVCLGFAEKAFEPYSSKSSQGWDALFLRHKVIPPQPALYLCCTLPYNTAIHTALTRPCMERAVAWDRVWSLQYRTHLLPVWSVPPAIQRFSSVLDDLEHFLLCLSCKKKLKESM